MKYNFSDSVLKPVTLKPYSYISPSISTRGKFFLVLLLLQVGMLFITESFSSILILIASTLASVTCEVIFKKLNENVSSNFLISIIQGILIGLFIPETYFPAAVFFITFLSLVISKYAFGGFAKSWVNPVALTVAVMFMLDAAKFPLFTVTMQNLQEKNAALSLIQNGTVHIQGFDSTITLFLNEYIFKHLGFSIPEGYVSLFWDSGSFIPAFRFNALTIFSSLVLFSFNIVDCLVPGIFIGVYVLLVRFVSPFFTGGIPMQGDILLSILTGGTLFSALYLFQCYGTTVQTKAGKIIYGIISGIVGFFVIGFGTSSIGAVFTVLIMNILTPVMEVFEEKSVAKKIQKILVPQSLALMEVENNGK